MKEQPFLKCYSEETVEELIAFESHYRIDSIILAFEEAVERKRLQFGYDKLSVLEKAILVIEKLEREVNNGGFDQFFLNTSLINLSSQFIPDLVPSLKLIECFKTAEIVSSAISALNINGELNSDTIYDAILKENKMRDEILEECDNDFYEYPDDIENKLFEFIKNHPNSIVL